MIRRRRLKKGWFRPSGYYLIPLFLLLAAISGALALAALVLALGVFILNILRARLPIDPGGDREPETHIYKQAGDTELKLDLWRPEGARKTGPLVIFAHGGGWISGFRNQPNNVSWCRFLASRGFTVASIDYRFAFRYKMADILEDYADAVSYLKKESSALKIDCSSIILMGLSAGGHLALSYAALNSHDKNSEALEGIKGVVAYYSPSDLRDLFSADHRSLFARLGAGTALKTLPGLDEETYRRYSPISWFTERMVPVMAVHGRADETVPYSSSVKMIRRLKVLGVKCRFLVHKTGGHGFEVRRKDYRTTRILEETVHFMRQAAAEHK